MHHTILFVIVFMEIRKKRSKKVALKKLHGALRGLLNKPQANRSYDKVDVTPGVIPEIVPTVVPKGKKESLGAPIKKMPLHVSSIDEKKDITYIVSRENQLIPKLTDSQIMERHKQADENMRNVWSSIISKYENVQHQGDVIDLRTGEVIEDNGHLRGISHDSHNMETRYQSSLRDILDIEDDEEDGEYSIWQDDDGQEEEEEGRSTEEEGEEEDDGTNDPYTLDYEEKLKGRIDS